MSLLDSQPAEQQTQVFWAKYEQHIQRGDSFLGVLRTTRRFKLTCSEKLLDSSRILKGIYGAIEVYSVVFPAGSYLCASTGNIGTKMMQFKVKGEKIILLIPVFSTVGLQ